MYVLKELLDNALAALEDHAVVNPMVWVEVTPEYVAVSDNGPGITDAILDKVLQFENFGGSNRHHKLPTRGAQGNAFATIVGIASAWSESPFIVVSRPSGPELTLEINVDNVKQAVNIERIQSGGNGRSRIEIPIPTLPWKRGGSTLEDLETVVKTMSHVNPHVTFTVTSSVGRSVTVSEFGSEAAMAGTPMCGAASWFTKEEFASRLAADLRARPQMELGAWLSEFHGTARRFVHPWGNTASLERLFDEVGEAVFSAKAEQLRQFALQNADVKRCDDPKFAPVGEDRLKAYLVDVAGADPNMDAQYHSKKGTFGPGVPFLLETCLLQMPEGVKQAPDPLVCMNRTALYGQPQFKSIEWREKVRGPWHTMSGDLSGLSRAYQIDHGKTPCAVVVHVTCPSPGYSGYGKQSFDTSWLAEPMAECFERITLSARRQRAGEIRRNKPDVSEQSIRDTLWELLPGVLDRDTEGGKLPIMLRQLYYGVRKIWALHHSKTLEYATYCAYVDLYETQIAGKAICLKDPRGTLIEPHSGRELRLGTDAVAKYEPKRWEGHTIIFCEKEQFAHVLKAYGVTKRYDAIIVGSKGFAVEATREVLQKYRRLLGDVVNIVALHDADPAGYMIGYDLANNLPRFGENVDVRVIDVGLTITEATAMGLQDEPFDLKKSVWSMVKGMRVKTVTDPNGSKRPLMEDAAWDFFMPKMLRGDQYPDWVADPKGRRTELNAMAPRQFIEWLETHLDRHGCKKVRPPDDVVADELKKARENKIKNEVGAYLMEIMGGDAVLEIIRQVGVPSFDLDKVLEAKPEQSWAYLTERAGQTGMDLRPLLDRVIGDKLRGGK